MADNDDEDTPDVTAPDEISALFIWLRERLNPGEMSTAEQLISNLIDACTAPVQSANDSENRILFSMDGSTRRGVQRMLMALDEAKAAVRPYVGDVAAGCYSESAVYCKALRAMGHDVTALAALDSAAASRAIFDKLKSRGIKRPPQIATDSKTTAAREQMFPNANRLRGR